MSLVEAHRRLLGIIHEAQAARLSRIAAGPLSEWDDFPCNDCMKHFGKPHWNGEGAAGPGAQRERWRGAWAKDATWSWSRASDMVRSLLGEVEIGARAVATRLRLASLVRRRRCPNLLLALTPGAATAPLPLPVERGASISAAERIVERIRVVPDTCLYRSLARYQALRRAGHPARFVMALDRAPPTSWATPGSSSTASPLGEEIDPRPHGDLRLPVRASR